MKAKDVLKLIKEKDIQVVDLRFIDLPGLWQHFSVSKWQVNEGMFEDGLGFDGSSIRGYQEIQESDMLLFPDPETAFIDPFMKEPTLVMICNVKDPMTREFYSRDARYIVKKAEAYLNKTGIADTAYFGPEAEFFIFNDIRFEQSYNKGSYHIDSDEGFWNSGREENPNLGYKIRYKQGYFPCPPGDSQQDIRSEMMLTLEQLGIKTEMHHHEVGTAGQAELDMMFSPMLQMADSLVKFKYVIKNVARQHGMTATFMPKPLFMDNGSGMHCHISLWKNGRNTFYKKGGYADLSQTAIYFIGGLLHHASSVLAFAAPTTNSYRRLVPGYEAPINLVYSSRNRSACVRIPRYSDSEKSKRIEFRPPDPSCNGYLAFSAMLMAGLDGIQNKIVPPAPIEKDIYELPAKEKKGIKNTPGSLEEALDALQKDHDYLLKGGVFTQDVIDTWLAYKRKEEVDAIRLRPHPYEFALYYDI